MAEEGSTPPSTLIADLLSRCTFPPGGSPLACAVSGGADSLALLVLAVAAGCDVTAIHVDHGLRAASAAEADVVRQAASRFGARVEIRRVSVPPGPNLEARARAARFAVLPVDVATGHTMDDQAETILVNLLRGAGADGLAGMEPGARHPILGLRRHETHAVCAAVGLAPGVRREQRRPGIRAQPDPPRAPPALRRRGRTRSRSVAGPAGGRAARRGGAVGRAGHRVAARPRRRPGRGPGGPPVGAPRRAALVAGARRRRAPAVAGRGRPHAGRGLRRRGRDRAFGGSPGAPDGWPAPGRARTRLR